MIYQYNVLKARIDRLDNLISNLEKFNLESNKNTEEIKIKEFTKDNLNTYLKEFSRNIYDSLLAFNELNICIENTKRYKEPIKRITMILNERKHIEDRETLIEKTKELKEIIKNYSHKIFEEEDYNFKAKEYYNNSLRYIVNNSSGYNFVTGTVVNSNGNVEVVSE